MNFFKMKPLLLAMTLGSLTTSAAAHLYTPKAVVDNVGQDRIQAVVQFHEPVAGDLYVATVLNGEFYFLAQTGQLTPDILPFRQNQDFSQDITALDFDTTGIPAGRYPLYQVVTEPGGDPLNFTHWIGGLAGLSVINFNVGLPTSESGDLNGDGFADDDHDHDGFHDDDHNRDGFHDDDANHDGYHDQTDEANDGVCSASTHEFYTEEDEDDDDHHGSDDHEENDDNEGSYDNDNDNEMIDDNPCSSDTVSPTTPTTPTTPITPTTPTVDTSAGQSLYSSNCSSCHGSNPARNGLRGTSAAQIQSAINANRGGMGFLKSLSSQELQSIADYLNTF